MPSPAIQSIDTYIQRGPIDRRKRQLIITPDFIRFEDKKQGEPFTIFSNEEICEYRYGINWISGYQFTIGREYVIFIRTSSGQVMKIGFKTFYSARKKAYHRLRTDILNALWDFFFGRIAGGYMLPLKTGRR